MNAITKKTLKLSPPILLVALAINPNTIIQMVLFTMLSLPFRYFLNEAPYIHKDERYIYLTTTGVITVALIWSAIYYGALLIHWIIIRKKQQTNE